MLFVDICLLLILYSLVGCIGILCKLAVEDRPEWLPKWLAWLLASPLVIGTGLLPIALALNM